MTIAGNHNALDVRDSILSLNQTRDSKYQKKLIFHDPRVSSSIKNAVRFLNRSYNLGILPPNKFAKPRPLEPFIIRIMSFICSCILTKRLSS